MQTLADTNRAALNPTLQSLSTTNGAYLNNLLDAASTAIRRVTGKDFTSTTYTEFYTVGPYIREPLNLRQYPVTRISRLAVANRCMQVINSGNGGSVQKATVETTTTGLTLTTTASGVATPTPLTFASYVTVQALANAVIAVGSGWSATVFGGSAGSYNLFPSADLKPLQGAFSAMVGGCYLDIYEDWYGWSTGAGFSTADGTASWGGATPFWRLEPNTGQLFIHAPRGQMVLQVTYTAGYSTIPNDIQEATVQLAQHLYQSSIANSTYSAYRMGQEAVTYRQKWPVQVQSILSSYTDYARTFSY